jgi:hypothetical protein
MSGSKLSNGELFMLYMVIEYFNNADPRPVYARFHEKGRMMPEGLGFVASWTEESGGKCFQIMECSRPELLKTWAANWEDLVRFEFIPVITGEEMAERIASARPATQDSTALQFDSKGQETA